MGDLEENASQQLQDPYDQAEAQAGPSETPQPTGTREPPHYLYQIVFSVVIVRIVSSGP